MGMWGDGGHAGYLEVVILRDSSSKWQVMVFLYTPFFLFFKLCCFYTIVEQI